MWSNSKRLWVCSPSFWSPQTKLTKGVWRVGVVHGCMEFGGGARCRKGVGNDHLCNAIILLHINFNDCMLWWVLQYCVYYNSIIMVITMLFNGITIKRNPVRRRINKVSHRHFACHAHSLTANFRLFTITPVTPIVKY